MTDLSFEDRPAPACYGDGVIRARAVVSASGGFEANLGWLRRYWGDAADNYLIRGPRENDGRVLAALYAHGAARGGRGAGLPRVASTRGRRASTAASPPGWTRSRSRSS